MGIPNLSTQILDLKLHQPCLCPVVDRPLLLSSLSGLSAYLSARELTMKRLSRSSPRPVIAS